MIIKKDNFRNCQKNIWPVNCINFPYLKTLFILLVDVKLANLCLHTYVCWLLRSLSDWINKITCLLFIGTQMQVELWLFNLEVPYVWVALGLNLRKYVHSGPILKKMCIINSLSLNFSFWVNTDTTIYICNLPSLILLHLDS